MAKHQADLLTLERVALVASAKARQLVDRTLQRDKLPARIAAAAEPIAVDLKIGQLVGGLAQRRHDEAVEEYDRLAAQIGPWATSIYPGSERWIHDLRVASLGFSLWEAQAPRYVAHQIVSEGRVLRPRFRYVDAEPTPSRVGRVPT